MTERRIDRQSPIPYYYQLQEILKEEIEVGRWGAGDLLPSEAGLQAQFGISRTVIRNALDVLEDDGQIFRVKGKGTVVAQPKFSYQAFAASEVRRTERGESSARLSQVMDVRYVTVGGHVGRILGLRTDQDVFQVTYVQSVEDAPAGLSQMFLRTDVTAELARIHGAKRLPDIEPGPGDIWAQLEQRFHVRVAKSEINIEATLVNEFEAGVLGLKPRTPAFLLTTFALDGKDGPIAFIRTCARSDQFRFSVVILHAGTDPGL